MGGVQFARNQFVTYRRPTGLFAGHQRNAVLLSKPFNAAITNGAQSVRGMKPTLTVFISGASDPAAHTDGIRPEIRDAPMAALACRNRRRVSKTVLSPIHAPHNKKRPAMPKHCRTPLSSKQTNRRWSVAKLSVEMNAIRMPEFRWRAERLLPPGDVILHPNMAEAARLLCSRYP